MENDTLLPDDNVARPTVMAGEFFAECRSCLSLEGETREMSTGTFVTITARRGERILLRTDSGFYRWESPQFLFKPKQ